MPHQISHDIIVLLFFLSIATGVFTPFVKYVTNKPMSASIVYAAVIQLITIAAYYLVAYAARQTFFPHRGPNVIVPYRELQLTQYTACLIVVPAFSTVLSKYLLKIKDAKDLKQIFIGNLWVIGAFLFAFWLLL
jgi:hypothetical protein